MANILLILPGIWLVCIIIAALPLNMNYQVEWSFIAWATYLLAILAYSLPTVIFYKYLPFRINRSQTNFIESDSIHPYQCRIDLYRKKKEELFLMALFACSLMSFIVQVISLGAIPLFNPLIVNTLRVKFALPVLHHAVMLSHYYIFYIIWSYLFSEVYYKKILMLILLCSIFFNVSYATKYGFIAPLAPYVFLFWKRYGISKRLILIFIFVFLGLVCFQGFRSFNEIAELENLPASYDQPITTIAYMYFLSMKTMLSHFVVVFENFAYFIDNFEIEYSYGKFCLFPLLALTHLRRFIDFGTVNGVHLEFFLGGGSHNTMPLILTPYMDFGVIGVPFYFFCLGLLGVFLVIKCKPYGIASNFILFNYALMITLSYYGDFVANVTFYYNSIFCLIHLGVSRRFTLIKPHKRVNLNE